RGRGRRVRRRRRRLRLQLTSSPCSNDEDGLGRREATEPVSRFAPSTAGVHPPTDGRAGGPPGPFAPRGALPPSGPPPARAAMCSVRLIEPDVGTTRASPPKRT